MMIYTPKPGRTLEIQGFVDKRQLDQFGHALVSHLKRDYAEQIINRLVEDCVDKEPDSAMNGYRWSIRVVVAPRKEFDEAMDEAYKAGFRAGAERK